MFSNKLFNIVFIFLFLLLSPSIGFSIENIDPDNDGSQFAWGENVGSLNLEPGGDGGRGVEVLDDKVLGYIWGENIGWCSLSCENSGTCLTVDFGVENDGIGTLSGYAWCENVGWINFAPLDGGIFINACGEFSGEAWGENIGWIIFRSDGANPFKVVTSWTSPVDTVAPETTLQTPVLEWYNADPVFSFSATDCGLGVFEVYYSINGGAVIPTSGSSATASITEEGIHTLTYYSVDTSNNIETSSSITVRVDKTPPDITITTPQDGASFNINAPVLADFSVTDTLSGVASTTSTVPDGNPINTSSEGSFSFLVSATDVAGNTDSLTNTYTIAYPGNIDPNDHFAWSENTGWFNFRPNRGRGVTVSDTSVIGDVWSENLGWILLDPTDNGVTNTIAGTLGGYAWSPAAGWISFSCENTSSCDQTNYGVRIVKLDESTGEFRGYGWAENFGWINFAPNGKGIKTSWVPTNQPPVADDQAVTTSEDTSHAITLTATDPEGELLTFSVVAGPSNGSLSGTAPDLNYTPNENYNGTDSFTFKANDGVFDSNEATIAINVSSTNDPPVIAVLPDASVNEGETLSSSGSFTDPDPDTWSGKVDYGDGTGPQTLSITDTTFTLSHVYGDNGSYGVSITVDDGTDTATGSFTVTVNNVAPLVDAGPDQTVDEGETVNLSPATFNDSGTLDTHISMIDWGDGTVEAGTVTESPYGPPGSTAGSDGTVAGSHVYNDNSAYTVTITVTDDDGASSADTFTITVNNIPPTANDKAATTDEDTPVGITLEATDPGSDVLSYYVVSGPANGNLSNTPPNLTYSPNPDYFGTDGFTYKANDGTDDSNIATVTITVDSVNDTPDAKNDVATTPEDTLVTIDAAANDSDVDGNLDPTSALESTGPTNGSLTNNGNGTFTYEPSLNFFGADSFAYQICDTDDLCDTATVNINVTAVNDLPEAVNDSYSTNEDTAYGKPSPGVLGNDSDIEGNSLTAALVSGPSNGNLTLNANGSFDYTPNANFNGTDSFTYRANDGTDLSEVAVVNIDVVAVNDIPVVSASSDATVNEGENFNGSGSFTDPDPDPWSASVDYGDGTGAQPLSLNPSKSFTLNHIYADNGAYAVTVTVDDGNGGTGSDTLQVTVQNVAPTIEAGPDQTADEGTPVNLSASFNDLGTLDTHTASINCGDATVEVGTVSETPSGPPGSTTGADGNVSGTHVYGDNGIYTVSVTVTDDDGASSADTFTVTVNNVAPTADAGASYTGNEGSAITLDGSGSSDQGGDTLNYDWDFDSDGQYDDATGVTPAFTSPVDGVFTVSLRVTDDDGGIDTDTATVTVVNVAPTATDLSATTDEDTPVGITLTATDPGSDTLTYAVVSGPASGTLSGAAPNLTYTPNADFYGTDSFTYKAYDGSAYSNIAPVNITVNPVNDPPVAGNDNATTDEDVAVVINVLSNDSAGPLNEDQYLTIIGFTQGGIGTVTNSSGTLTYTPNPDLNGTDSFTYTVQDSGGLADTATVDVTVQAVNDSPTISIDQSSQNVQYSDGIAPVTITGTDIDSNALSISDSGLPANLSIVDNGCSVESPAPSTPKTCSWRLEGIAEVVAGTYPITFAVTDEELSSSTTFNLVVKAEDTNVRFDDFNPVAVRVASPGGDSGEFTLTVHVRESTPDAVPTDPSGAVPYPGDINLAAVSMSLVPVGPGGNSTGDCIINSVIGTGYDSIKTVTCSFFEVPVNTYTAQVTTDGGYYEGSGEDVLTVFDPSLGFATGGGWFYWPGTDEKTNFGFTMKYNKKGEKVQGSLLLIRHLPDGIYRIKSNALYGLSLGETNEGSGWASFSGKATYKEPNWDEPIGNHEFLVYIEDRNEPGTGLDQFWVELKDKDGAIVDAISRPRPATDNTIPLEGGNIVVPHSGGGN